MEKMKTKITQLYVDYIKPSRSIETYMLSNGKCFCIVYIYNYDGRHFRVFGSILSLIGFFNGENQGDYNFEDEDELDNFLENYPINNSAGYNMDGIKELIFYENNQQIVFDNEKKQH